MCARRASGHLVGGYEDPHHNLDNSLREQVSVDCIQILDPAWKSDPSTKSMLKMLAL